MSKFIGISHAAFATSDMDKTIRFWRDLLGLRLVYTQGGPGNRQYFFEVADQVFIVFFEWPEVERVRYHHPGAPEKGPFAFDHVAIRVADEEALWHMTALLEAAEIPMTDVVDHGLCKSVYTFDPNGVPVEFLCATEGADVCTGPLFNDPEPVDTVKEGADPVPGHWPEPETIPEDERIVIAGAGSEDFN